MRDQYKPESSSGEPEPEVGGTTAADDDSLDRVLRRKRTARSEAADALGGGTDLGRAVLSQPEATGSEARPAAEGWLAGSWKSPGGTAGIEPRPGGASWPISVTGGGQESILSNWETFRASPYYRVFGVMAWIVALFVIWRVGSAFLASDFMRQVLALEAPFRAIPTPDSAVVSEVSLKSAALVGAPLVLAVFWFAGAYQLDRAARRTFQFDETLDSRYPGGYVLIAIVCVFPLMVAGVIGAAWGGVSLVSWANQHESWGPVVALLALVVGFGVIVWLVDGGIRRGGSGGRSRP